MSTISNIAQTQALNTQATAAEKSQTKLVGDYNDFLTLLTAQLQNQNPLEPMDAKEFTNQLTQFSGVEQSIQTNTLLERLISSNETSLATSLVNYLGSTITAEGNATRLENGQAKWDYDVEGKGENAEITVRNSAGAIMYQTTQPTTAGRHSFIWDGKTAAGSQVPDGIYSIAINASDADGNNVPVKTEISGKVDGVDMSGATPTLAIGTATFPISSVKSIN